MSYLSTILFSRLSIYIKTFTYVVLKVLIYIFRENSFKSKY